MELKTNQRKLGKNHFSLFQWVPKIAGRMKSSGMVSSPVNLEIVSGLLAEIINFASGINLFRSKIVFSRTAALPTLEIE